MVHVMRKGTASAIPFVVELMLKQEGCAYWSPFWLLASSM